MNCTDIIKDLFYKHIDDIEKADIFLAAQYFCNKIFTTDMLVGDGNSSQFKKQFQKNCCNESLVAALCGIIDVYFNLNFELNCSEPINQIEGSYYFEPTDTQYDFLTYVFMSIFLPLGIIGNVMILYAIIRIKCLPVQTGYFLNSLAVADLGVIAEFIAFFIYHHNDGYVPDRVHKYLLPSLDMFFGCVSLLQITCISIERAVAVTWPLKYPTLISVTRAKLGVQAIWCFSALQFLLALLRIPIKSPLYASIIFYLAVTILLLIPMVVITIAYSFVVVSAYQNISHERQRIKMLTFLLRNNEFVTEVDEMNNTKSTWKISTIRCREIKLSINVAIIVLPFLGCWGFFVFAHIYEVISGYRFAGFTNWLIFILPFSVSSMNPVFYLIFTRSLRKAVKSLIKRNVRRRLSRTELSSVTLNSTANGSRRESSSTNMVSNFHTRKVGRDFSYLVGNNRLDEEDLVTR